MMKRLPFAGLLACCLLLSSCAATENLWKATTNLAGSLQGLAGAYEKDSPDQICQARSSNPISAEDRYVGKYMMITGKVTNISETYAREPMSTGLQKVPLLGVQVSPKHTIDATLSSLEKLAVRKLNRGQVITVKGKIKTIGSGSSCYIQLENTAIIENPDAQIK